MIDFVKASGGLQYATKIMNEYFQEALQILNEFPESEYRNSLEGLVRYTIERKNKRPTFGLLLFCQQFFDQAIVLFHPLFKIDACTWTVESCVNMSYISFLI